MKPHIGLHDESRTALVELLVTILADDFVLAIKSRGYGWNVLGPGFPALHAFFGTQYAELDGMVAETAERIRALGGLVPGTVAELGERTRLGESPAEYPDARGMAMTLLANHESAAAWLREDIAAVAARLEDPPTADLLTHLLARHERMAWQLRSTLASLEQL
jgi:starvation-inducible DNA-binding protein